MTNQCIFPTRSEMVGCAHWGNGQKGSGYGFSETTGDAAKVLPQFCSFGVSRAEQAAYSRYLSIVKTLRCIDQTADTRRVVWVIYSITKMGKPNDAESVAVNVIAHKKRYVF